MRFTIDYKSLNSAVSAIQGAVARKSTISMLEHVYVNASGESVTLRATDMDMQASITTDAAVETEGECLIPGNALSGIAKRARGDVTFTLDVGHVTITTGRSKVTLPVLPVDQFPYLINPDGVSVDMDGDVFSDLIRNTQFACERHQGGREYLEGVHITSRDGMMYGVATNTHVMAIASADCPTAFDGLTIPMQSLNQIVGMAAKHTSVTLTFADGKFALKGDGFEFVTKTIDGQFPDYERVIPKGNDKSMTTDLAPFREAIDIASIVADGKVKAVTLDMSQDNNSVSLTMSGGDGRQAENVIDCEADCDLTVKYNVSYILGALNALDCSSIRFEFGEANGPCILKDPDDPYTQFIIMPMRV